MFSRFSSCILWAAAITCNAAAADTVLRICADPNNLPFSNDKQQGFENRVAELIAADLNATIEYTWWSMRRGFVRNALNEGRCDILMGMPVDSEMVLPTRPYYRSTYVFASRKDRNLHLKSLNDERLNSWRIGVQLIGNDLAPPAHALAARGITASLIPYSLYGHYGEPNPPAKVIDAVEKGDVDLAIVWGPLAGYFARRSDVPLEVVPITPQSWQSVPFVFSISAAVRKGNSALRTQLDNAIEHQCTAIQKVLAEYAVPQVPEGEQTCAASR